MAYCKNCGKEVTENAKTCPHCLADQTTAPNTSTPAPVVDNGGFLWGLLGCCIPIVGLVLFLVWKDTKPKTAKAAGIGALVCVIAYAVFYLFVFVIGIGSGLFA